jgi:hypothetical protein
MRSKQYVIESCDNVGKERFSLVEKLIDIGSYPVVNVLGLLLQDKSTKKEYYLGYRHLRGTGRRLHG